MLIVPRAEWVARPPLFRNTIATPTLELWLHHLAAEWHGPEGMRRTQDFHMDSRGWSDYAYSFAVDDLDQTIYEGRGAGVAGGHTEGHNQVSHAICVMGNFDSRPAAEATIAKVADLVRHGREQGWWHDLTGGHRDVNQTACPGAYLYPRITDIQSLATTEEDDLTDEDRYTLNNTAAAVGQIAGLMANVAPAVGRLEASAQSITTRLDAIEAGGGAVDLDALAAKVADLLAARLAS